MFYKLFLDIKKSLNWLCGWVLSKLVSNEFRVFVSKRKRVSDLILLFSWNSIEFFDWTCEWNR